MAEDGGNQPVRKKARISFDSGTIQVLVGPNKERFDVHENLICSWSGFFEATCSERWSKSDHSSQTPAKVIELPEDDPQTFDIYMHLLYKDWVNVGDPKDAYDDEAEYNEDEIKQLRLVATWVLADKLRDISSASEVMDALISDCASPDVELGGLTPHAALKVAQSTMSGSPLWKFATDYYIYAADECQMEKVLSSDPCPRDFVADILHGQTLLDVWSRGIGYAWDNHTERNRCKYNHYGCFKRSCGYCSRDQVAKTSTRKG